MSLLLLSLTAFLICLCLTPVCRAAAERLGLLDAPDHGRKQHASPVPRIGGVAIAAAYGGSFLVLLLSGVSGGDLVASHHPAVYRILPAVLIVFLIGLADDLAGLAPWQKLSGQIVAAVFAYMGGVRVLGVAGIETQEVWWSLPLTLVWLIGCTNAFNLIDGVDGLAAGIGLCATLTTLLIALLNGDTALAIATAPLAGALAAFLRYNFNPASIFLGDCGSLTVGFLLGCYGVLWSQKSATLLGMTAPLMMLAVPLLDTGVAIVRRFLRGRPVFDADRGHIHHRLLDRGLTPRRVVLLLYGFGALGAMLSVLHTLASRRYAHLTLILFCAAAAIAISRLRYVEFGVARSVLLGGEVRRLVSDRIRLDQLQSALAAAPTPLDYWLTLRQGAPAFGLSADALTLCGESFEAVSPGAGWSIRIPLGDLGQARLSRTAGPDAAPASLAAFADAVARTTDRSRGTLRPSRSLDPDILALAQRLAGAGPVPAQIN